MTIPTPPHELVNHCTTIWNNTLYAYTPEAFQSLPLGPGGNWTQEKMGVSAKGVTCSMGSVEGDISKPALFVIGGSTTNPSESYPGLQRYSFLDQKWETIKPAVPVTENRLHHGSTFINASSSILLYAGSQDGITGPSTQTFLISTIAPYGVEAYNSAAPPVRDPIVVEWNDTTAAMLGGDTANRQVFVFTPGGVGWADSGVTLGEGIPDHSQASCTVTSLADGSKVLETFDMSASPNKVTRTVLINTDGTVATMNATIGDADSSSSSSSSSTTSGLDRRELTLNNFPVYNGSLAPTATRNDFSLAQAADGTVVISGGSREDVLCIFNTTQNSWINASSLLRAQQTTLGLGSPSSTAAIPSATISSVATSSAASQTGSNKNDGTSRALVILGGVLGAIFGVAALCIIALLLLRWAKKRKHGAHKRRQSDHPAEEKAERRSGSFSLHSNDQQPFRQAGVPMGRGPTPSSDSAAFFKEVGERPSSRQSPYSLPTSKPKPSITRPIPMETVSEKSIEKSLAGSGLASSEEIDPSMNQAANRKTDEGWSKYFQGNNAVNLAGARDTYDSQVTESDYRNSGWPDFTAPQSPTDSRYTIGAGTQLRRGNVAMGSPSLEHGPTRNGAGMAVSEGIPGKISRAESYSSGMSDEDAGQKVDESIDYDRIGEAYSSGIPASINDDQPWNALGNYRTPHRVSSYYPQSSVYGGPRDGESTVSSALVPPLNARPTTRWNFDGDSAPALPAPITNTESKPSRPARPSGASEQMRDYFGETSGRSRTPNDMSWLNLGNNR